MFGRTRRGRTTKNVICGVWASFYTSCCAGILHSPASVEKIVAGREARPVRLVSFDIFIVKHQSFWRNGCRSSPYLQCSVCLFSGFFDSQPNLYVFGD